MQQLPESRKYSFIHHLCWGVLGNHDPARTWILIVTECAVYLDDSGHPDDQPFVVVAGFLSTESEWLAFQPEWENALNRHNVSVPFHATDFQRTFRKRKNRGAILEELTGIINNRTLAALCVLLDVAAYKKVNDIYALEESVGTPYAIAARCVAKYINQWKSQYFKADDHLLVFVEEGTKHKGDMEEAFRRDALPVPQTVPKSLAMAQPADLLAWETFYFTQTHNRRRSLLNLLNDRLVYEGILREKNLITTCKNANAPLRSRLAANAEIVFHSTPKRKRKRTIK